MDLQQAVADEQRRGNAGLDRLLVLAADDEAIDDGVHLRGRRRAAAARLGFSRRVVCRLGSTVSDRSIGLPSTIRRRQPFLRSSVKSTSSVFAVDLEHRRAQLDLGALRQREDRFEDLARRCGSAPARRCGGNAAGRSWRTAGSGSWRCRSSCRRSSAGCSTSVFCSMEITGERPKTKSTSGLRDLRDEALGVARQRLHVAPLALGVDRVERQARLARAREAGDDDQRVARNLDRDVLQVVDARALDGDGRARGGSRCRVAFIASCLVRLRRHVADVEERQLLHLDVARSS